MNTPPLRPTQNYVLIRLHEGAKPEGVLLPEHLQVKPYGEVLAVGPDCSTRRIGNGQHYNLQIGDRVHFLPSSLIGYDESERTCFIAEPSILGVYVD